MNAKPSRPRRDPQALGDVLADLMARRGYAQVSAHEECRKAWEETVGNLTQFTRATELKRGVLQVVVTNSVVMQELVFRKSELLVAVSKKLTNHKIKDLRFRIGEIA